MVSIGEGEGTLECRAEGAVEGGEGVGSGAGTCGCVWAGGAGVFVQISV